MDRIDKFLSANGKISRKEAARLCRDGEVTVNGVPVCDSSQKISPEKDEVVCRGQKIEYREHIYIMMNKPEGIVSASEDKKEKTVVDLVPEKLFRPGLFPAGRLDKDSTGFVLITDDGDFAHNILSPKKHIEKTYLVSLKEEMTDGDILALEKGIALKNGTSFLPSKIERISEREYKVVLSEGKYHQIKRMFGYTGNCVTSLKRIKMGNLELDESLSPGECREITEDEISLILKGRAEK